MALINCPECGKEISDKSVACPHCGFPIESESITNNTELPKVEPKTSTNTNPEKSDNSCIGCIIFFGPAGAPLKHAGEPMHHLMSELHQ